MDGLRETIEKIERERVRLLVDGNTMAAEPFHGDDFELVNPFGGRVNKAQYLGAIASGIINYQSWEPGTIDIRLYEKVAVLRYESELEIIAFGELIPLSKYLHTDIYEERNDDWEIVLSHATKVVHLPLLRDSPTEKQLKSKLSSE